MMFTNRDRELFRLLGQVRMMTLKQIQQHVFKGASRPVVQRRLGKLRKRRVLKSVQSSRYGQLAWTLCAETARAVEVEQKAFKRSPNLYCIEHDLIVTDIALEWMRLGLVEKWEAAIFIEIKDFGGHIPDADVRGPAFKNIVSIEYENSLKSTCELWKALRSYGGDLGSHEVFYYWRNERLARQLQRQTFSRIHSDSRIWLADSGIDKGIAHSFTCIATGEKLDLNNVQYQT